MHLSVQLKHRTGELRAGHTFEKIEKYHAAHIKNMINTAFGYSVRPDEAFRLEFREVKVEEDDATGKTILVLEMRGKGGVG